MYERMLDKNTTPTQNDIEGYIGNKACELVNYFEELLNSKYEIVKELKFPFGNNYGWGYKYSKKTTHICYLFFEKEAFTILVQINGKGKEKLNLIADSLLPKTMNVWENRYPCGDGGWLNYRAFNKEELDDIIKIIEIKVKPQKLIK